MSRSGSVFETGSDGHLDHNNNKDNNIPENENIDRSRRGTQAPVVHSPAARTPVRHPNLFDDYVPMFPFSSPGNRYGGTTSWVRTRSTFRGHPVRSFHFDADLQSRRGHEVPNLNLAPARNISDSPIFQVNMKLILDIYEPCSYYLS
jgi:hypothetical protein